MPLRSADLDGDGAPNVVMPDTAIGLWDATRVSVLLGDENVDSMLRLDRHFLQGCAVECRDWRRQSRRRIRPRTRPYGPRVNDAKRIAVRVLLGDGRGGFRPKKRRQQVVRAESSCQCGTSCDGNCSSHYTQLERETKNGQSRCWD